MSNANRVFNWFTPPRFALLLALLVFASFPQVILGLQTFVARDYGFFAYPLAHFQRDCFWRGQIPLWDPYNDCGIPFLAQWNTMPLYPPALIYLLLPLTWGLGIFCLLHLWFGGLGMYFLARKWTGNDFAAAFAGTAFVFSGLTLNLLMWPSHTATFSWMPWVVLTVERAWGKGEDGAAKPSEGGRRRAIFIAAICGALQMLSGGPEIIFFTWALLLALWIQQLIKNEFPRKTFWRFPAVIGLVAALSAAQLLPFLDLAAHSQRHAGYADLRWAMPANGWANFLVPMAFGAIRGEGIFFQNDQFWTSSYYLGLGTLWLALLAIWICPNRRVWLLVIVAAVAVIFALGGNTPIFPAIRKIFPEFGLVTYPVKYLLLVTFAAPLLASFSLAQLCEQNLRRQIFVIGAVLLVLLVVVTALAGKLPHPLPDYLNPGPILAAHANGLSRIGFLILTGLLLLVLARRPQINGTSQGSTESRPTDRQARRLNLPLPQIFSAAPLLLIFVAWLDVLTHEPSQNPTVPPNIYQPNLARETLNMRPQPELGGSRALVSPKAFMQFIQLGLQDPKANYLAKRAGYCADCNLLDAVPKVDGFFSLAPRHNNDLFSLIYGATNDFPRLDDFLGVSQITAPDQMYHWLPRRTFLPLVTAGQMPVFFNHPETLWALTQSNFNGSKMVLLPPEAKPFVTVTHPTAARVLNSKFEIQKVEIQVEASAPALVVIAQTFYHDWRVLVDGRPVPLLRANDAFQAVQVSAGQHSIQLLYQDRAFEAGAGLSLIAWLICLYGGWTRRGGAAMDLTQMRKGAKKFQMKKSGKPEEAKRR